MNLKITREKLRPMLPVHGVGNGPASFPFAKTRETEFRAAGIPFSRTHDTEGFYGSGEFVNIHCIFKNFDADANDPASYDFRCTDLYIKHILEAGTQVFYRLGESIENPNMSRILPMYIHPPKDYFKWAQICEHIIRHYNEGWANGFHYGIRYWEIWNEPDNKNMWTGTPEDFFELYRVTANHLKQCFPDLKIGGPGCSGFYAATREDVIPWFKMLIPWAKNFLRAITTPGQEAPLDFFSWHCYTDSVDELAAHCRFVKNLLAEYGLSDTESILDEWNYARDWDYQEGLFRKSMTSAAMVGGCLLAMQEAAVDAGMYYDAEIRRTAFCGLFDGESKCQKPYYALYAFNELYKLGTQVQIDFENGNGYYGLAAANDAEIAVMLVNYAASPETITLEVPDDCVSAEIYCVDKDHDYQQIDRKCCIDEQFTLNLPEDTILVIKLHR